MRAEISQAKFTKIKELAQDQFRRIWQGEYINPPSLVTEIRFESAPSGDVIFAEVEYGDKRVQQYTVVIE